MRAWPGERLQMRLPVALVGCGLLLDGLAEDTTVLHGPVSVRRVLALTLCAATGGERRGELRKLAARAPLLVLAGIRAARRGGLHRASSSWCAGR